MTRVGRILPVAGRLFSDTMDGYFPLHESVRQMLERNGFASAWVSILHAPMMDLPEIAADAPVPLRLRRESAGTIRRMALVAVLSGDGVALRGVARWSWLGDRGPEEVFRPEWRLAEPVFLRGIGFEPGDTATGDFGMLAPAGPGSPVAILQPARDATTLPSRGEVRVWGVDTDDIRPEARPGEGGVISGERMRLDAAAGARERIVVNLADAAVADAAARLAQER